ncbi:MAG: hypothetical protein ABSB73_09670 [Solirubrobacteraceae bacterium]|jgi:hypothetical protein
MTGRAHAPAVAPPLAVGDRLTYTAPDGRIAHYRVIAVNEPQDWALAVLSLDQLHELRESKDPYARHPFARLKADEPGWGDVTATPESLASSYGWARDNRPAGVQAGRP